jgi:hypothetical protein
MSSLSMSLNTLLRHFAPEHNFARGIFFDHDNTLRNKKYGKLGATLPPSKKFTQKSSQILTPEPLTDERDSKDLSPMFWRY